MRMTSNWRQIAHGPKIEYCSALKLGSLFPFYAENIKAYTAAFFPNQSFSCPLEPKLFKADNILVIRNVYNSSSQSTSQDAVHEPIQLSLPNGKYRITVHFSTNTDPYAMFFQWVEDINFRLAEDKF